MPRSYRYLHYDVFTNHLFGGNQLAVFLDGRGLSAETMQAIAHEMNFSETTFILPSETPGTDVRMRIFTPGSELPMAGHPTIGSTFALARCGVITPPRDTFMFGLGVGPVAVSLIWRGDQLSFAWMTQALPEFGEAMLDADSADLAAAMLGLPTSMITGTHLPVQIVSCGVPFLFVPLTTRAAVDGAALRAHAFQDFLERDEAEASGVFVLSTEAGADGATVYSRMFAPALGIAEDPATGGASGPLGCYLVRHKAVPADKAEAMLSLQGVKMGRPSHIHISIGIDAGAVTTVRVGGEAVLAGEATLYI